MIIVAVDYYGNAHWEIYDITEYVHKLTPKQQTPQTMARRQPKVWTQNIQGKIEPKGATSHHYILGNTPHIPWIRLDGELQRCMTLTIRPGGHTVSIEPLNISMDPNAEVCGIFILRCYGLWRYGTLRILADGAELATIVFAYTIGIQILPALLLSPLLLLAFAELLARRYRGRRK